MKLYLSSFRLGDTPQKFSALFGENKKVAVIANAADSKNIDERRISVEKEFEWLREIGLEPEEFDLRNYFTDDSKLITDFKKFGGTWVRGGNSFILGRAMYQSGFDSVLDEYNTKEKNFVYGGYSAGVCVLAPDLIGIERVDDPNIVPDRYMKKVIWEGIGIIDFHFAPHFRSNHPETQLVEETVNLWKAQGINFKALRDGEVIIIE